MLRRHFTRTLLGTAGLLVAVLAPWVLAAQTVRLLGLLGAAEPSLTQLGAFAAAALGLATLALIPIVTTASALVTLWRWDRDGTLRALAACGMHPAAVVALGRRGFFALAVAASVVTVLGEPALARSLRGTLATLAQRALTRTVQRGGAMALTDEVAILAPEGLPGPRWVVLRSPQGAPRAVLAADSVAVQGAPTAQLRLGGVAWLARSSEGTVRGTARAVTVRAGVPERVEAMVTRELLEPVWVRDPAVARRHALRWAVALLGAVGALLASAVQAGTRGPRSRRFLLGLLAGLGALVGGHRLLLRAVALQGPWWGAHGAALAVVFGLWALAEGVLGAVRRRRAVL
ncbi:MAG: hypothetical protein HY909_19130 [Deltaproteobacteria bacterium]|nr:hypothetical protein [Deltaproteobacteria bacterium]